MIDLPKAEVIDLLRQVAASKDAASKTLYKHYFDFLYAFVRHRLPEDAASEEVTQDVFWAVFAEPEDFSGDSKFSTWLCAIARNKSADWWRKNRGHFSQESMDDEFLENQVNPDWDFTKSLEVAQDHAALRHCIDRLESHRKEMVFWVYYQYESMDSAAKYFDCAPGTVKSRLYAIRNLLHDCMTRWIAGGRYG